MRAGTQRNLALALVVGAAFAASPLTSARRVYASLFLGTLIAALTFAWASWRDARAGVAEPEVALRWPSLSASGWVALLLSGVVFGPAVQGLWHHYTTSVWENGHGILLPLVIVALARYCLRDDPGEDAESSAWGWLPLAAGLGLVALDSAVGNLVFAVLGLTLFLTGASLLLLGARRTRRLAVPLGLTLFLMPLPTSLGSFLGLPELSAAGTAVLLRAAGFTVIHEGVVLMLPREQFAVSANCSGFSMLYAGVAFAIALARWRGSALRAALLLAAVYPLALVASAVRSAALVALCESQGIGFAETPLHTLSGIGAFYALLLALFLIALPRVGRRAP